MFANSGTVISLSICMLLSGLFAMCVLWSVRVLVARPTLAVNRGTKCSVTFTTTLSLRVGSFICVNGVSRCLKFVARLSAGAASATVSTLVTTRAR